MAKVSSATATQGGDYGPVIDRYEEVDGYRIGFTTFREDVDGTPLMKGLPDDRCQCLARRVPSRKRQALEEKAGRWCCAWDGRRRPAAHLERTLCGGSPLAHPDPRGKGGSGR